MSESYNEWLVVDLVDGEIEVVAVDERSFIENDEHNNLLHGWTDDDGTRYTSTCWNNWVGWDVMDEESYYARFTDR